MSDDLPAAAERLLHEVDISVATGYGDGADDLPRFEDDIKAVARFALAAAALKAALAAEAETFKAENQRLRREMHHAADRLFDLLECADHRDSVGDVMVDLRRATRSALDAAPAVAPGASDAGELAAMSSDDIELIIDALECFQDDNSGVDDRVGQAAELTRRLEDVYVFTYRPGRV